MVSVNCLASLYCLSQNKFSLIKFCKHTDILKACHCFPLVTLRLYFSHSWNTFSCHYLSFKILSTKISNLTLKNKKRLQNVKQKYSIQVLEHFIYISWVKQQPSNTTDKQTINKVQGLLMESLKLPDGVTLFTYLA